MIFFAELGWAQPCDVWSTGCILFEYYRGFTLFQVGFFFPENLNVQKGSELDEGEGNTHQALKIRIECENEPWKRAGLRSALLEGQASAHF